MEKAHKEEILAIAQNSPQATRENIQPKRHTIKNRKTGEKRVFNPKTFRNNMSVFGLCILLEFAMAVMITNELKNGDVYQDSYYKEYNIEMNNMQNEREHQQALEENRAKEAAAERKMMEDAQNAITR